MHPAKVQTDARDALKRLTDLPNIGKAGAADLHLIGILQPADLLGRCPFKMYEQLCEVTAARHDPCVIDVFMSVTRFMDGEAPQPWWAFTEERKKLFSPQGIQK